MLTRFFGDTPPRWLLLGLAHLSVIPASIEAYNHLERWPLFACCVAWALVMTIAEGLEKGITVKVGTVKGGVTIIKRDGMQ